MWFLFLTMCQHQHLSNGQRMTTSQYQALRSWSSCPPAVSRLQHHPRRRDCCEGSWHKQHWHGAVGLAVSGAMHICCWHPFVLDVEAKQPTLCTFYIAKMITALHYEICLGFIYFLLKFSTGVFDMGIEVGLGNFQGHFGHACWRGYRHMHAQLIHQMLVLLWRRVSDGFHFVNQCDGYPR